MKNIVFLITALLICTLNCNSQNKPALKDGTFVGRSQSIYKQEPFVGISKLTILKGEIANIDFSILDTSKNELFDDKYEKHFIGVNEEYVLQCRNDWAGVKRYPKVLLQKQKLDKVDAVTGATWSYNMFKSATSIALQKAKN